MKLVNKPKQGTDTHRTHKTKDDFLRWLKKQEASKKQVQPASRLSEKSE